MEQLGQMGRIGRHSSRRIHPLLRLRVSLSLVVFSHYTTDFVSRCLSQRRRRKAGRTPFYGTGWTTKLPGGAPPPYNANANSNNQQYQPPQTYNQYGNNNNTSSVPQGGYYGQSGAPDYNQQGGANQAYFGGQRSDVEMQRPENAYNNSFAPPAGPPPSKVH